MTFIYDDGRRVLRHCAPWQTDNENETVLELRPVQTQSDDFIQITAATNEPNLKRKKGDRVYFIHMLSREDAQLLWGFLGEQLNIE